MRVIRISEQNRPLLSSAIIFGIIGVIFSAIRMDLLWVLTSILYTALIYYISKISDMDKIQHGLFKWTPIPLVLGITGIFPYIGRFWLFGDLAFAAFAPILGFMMILNLTHHTRFEPNLYFSTAFIFLFTLSAGSVLGIVRFFNDEYLGTIYLASNYQLMIELLIIILFGMIGAMIHLIYFFYLDRNLSKDQNNNFIRDLRSEFMLSVKYFKTHYFKLLNSYFWCKEKRSLLMTSKALQVGIFVLIFYNLAVRNFWGYSVALISFILSIFTPIYSRFLNTKASPSFHFWLSAALFLYAAGESLRFQIRFGWWNDFTHFIAGIVVGALVIIYLLYLDDIFENLQIPSKTIPIFVLIFILSIGVLWETFEFMVDNLFGTSLQASLQDTVHDMIGNTIGAFFALIITDLFTPFKVFREVHQRDKKTFRKIDITAYLGNKPVSVVVIICGIIGLFFSLLISDLTLSIISSVFIALIFGISIFSKKEC